MIRFKGIIYDTLVLVYLTIS